MLLGIVLHAMMSFIVTPFPWPVHDPQRSFVFDSLLFLIHGFRMPLFFFIAGFFAHLLVQRNGVATFARQRAQRIGIPFVAGMALIIPMVAIIWGWSDPAGAARESAARAGSILQFPTGHLWFLEMLLILYVLAIAGNALLRRAPANVVARLDAGFDCLLRQRLKPLLLAPPTMLLLAFGPFVPEIDQPGVHLLPGWQAVAYYGLFFGAGWWLHRRLHLLDTLRRWLPMSFVLAGVCYLLVGVGVRLLEAGRGDPALVKLLAWGSAAVYTWSMTFALTGLFLKIASTHSAWMRYLADASYWWYLWHIPPVMVLQAVVAPWGVPAVVKLLVIVGGTVAILWPTYQLFVRYTWIGRLLNGPRERPLKVQPAVA